MELLHRMLFVSKKCMGGNI